MCVYVRRDTQGGEEVAQARGKGIKEAAHANTLAKYKSKNSVYLSMQEPGVWCMASTAMASTAMPPPPPQ
eukprot:366341-Chlamydomonas_euryale.AAC.12